MTPIRWFLDINKKCSQAIAKLFPNKKFVIGDYYREQIRNSLADGITVVDVGGGREWQFRNERKRFSGLKLIAVDISAEELAYNHDADQKVVFAMGIDDHLPIDDNSVDMVTSHMVMEHFSNNDKAVREIFRVLKPGGKFISLMPNKFALFAVINQILPNKLVKTLLYAIKPSEKGVKGFKAYYNKTYYPALRKLLEGHGFADIKFTFSYHQSEYFDFFVPFEIISLVWDFLMYIFGIKPLCAYNCFIATK